MTDHHIYGTSTHTADELARLVSDRLGLVFTERDSDYRGVYHLAGSPNGRIEIQPNPIPGDDGDFYAPEHSSAQVLLLTTTSTPDPGLHPSATGRHRREVHGRPPSRDPARRSARHVQRGRGGLDTHHPAGGART
ncbi:hypothetical protein [Streptomyces phaeoluteigriseus]